MKNTGGANSRISEMVVTVVGVSEDQRIMVRDPMGNEIEIDGSVRQKVGGWPAKGERWIISRRGNVWTMDMLVGAPPRTVISGSRRGLHPVQEQLLDTLAGLGIVDDQTKP